MGAGLKILARTGAVATGAIAILLCAPTFAYALCNSNAAIALGAEGENDLACGTAALASGVASVNTSFAIDFFSFASPFVTSPAGSKPDTIQSGVWLRALGGGGSVTSKFSGTGGNGAFSGNTKIPTGFFGIQGGLDSGLLNLGNSGWNAHGGLTIGTATANPSLPSDEIGQPSDESMSARLQPGFVGVYGVFTKDNFFANVQLRHIWQNITFTDNDFILTNAKLNGDTWDGSVAAGYRINFTNFFVEPSAGLDLSRTTFNRLGAGNASNGSFLDTIPSGTLAISPINSALGVVGARVGTVIPTSNITWLPYVSANLWHEFAGDVQTQYLVTPSATHGTAPSVNLSTSRVGTFGQFAAGVAAQIANTGLVTYVRADVRTGANVQGWTLSGGVRYSF